MRRSLNFWLLGVLVVCGVSFWIGRGTPLPGRQRKGPAAGRVGGQEAAELPAGLQLVVLNGTDVGGLARNFGLLLGRGGLAPVRYGNAAPQDYQSSFLVNRRLSAAQVSSLRDFLGGIQVLQEYDGRSTEDAVLVLGADHDRLRSALAAKEP